jgi:hypothetical protein
VVEVLAAVDPELQPERSTPRMSNAGGAMNLNVMFIRPIAIAGFSMNVIAPPKKPSSERIA